ncbi:MAG: CPBP family intramembrane glutamic endopeptidase [Candidatus Diapherotrites archaeon]
MAFWLLDLFFFFLPLCWLWIEKKQGMPLSAKKAKLLLSELGFKREKAKIVLQKTILLLGALLLTATILALALNMAGLNDTKLVEEHAKEIIAIPWLAAYILLVRVPCEEIFFRGFLQREIGKLGTTTGILGSTLLFAIAHLAYGSIGEIIGTFVLGALLAIAYHRSKNIIINILAHIAYNFIIFLSIMW